MGLFSKKENDKVNGNLIDNNMEKEKIANYAINFLLEKNIVNDLNNVKCEYGYIFYFENHGYEALFKIIKDSNIYYFAFQENHLQLLNMDEKTYNAFTESFLEMYN